MPCMAPMRRRPRSRRSRSSSPTWKSRPAAEARNVSFRRRWFPPCGAAGAAARGAGEEGGGGGPEESQRGEREGGRREQGGERKKHTRPGGVVFAVGGR